MSAPKRKTNHREINSSAGKGDSLRKVDKAKYDENYDAIFRKKDKCETNCKCNPKKK